MVKKPKNQSFDFKKRNYRGSGGFAVGESFVILAKPCFTKEERNKLIELVEEKSMAAVVNSSLNTQNSNIRRSRIRWLADDEFAWVYKKLWKVVQEANKKYLFNIKDFRSPAQVAIYDESEEGFYDWHMDMSPPDMTRKISISLPLNDESEYEGGKLEFAEGASVVQAPQLAGNVVVFPGFLKHRVTPVTKGKRYSLVAWVGGPAFK